MKKTIGILLAIIFMIAVLNASTAEVVDLPGTPVVGIAWRADTDSKFFANACRAVEEAGGTWVMLDQVCSADLEYTDTNGVRMIEAVERTDKAFALGVQLHPEAALVKHLDDAGNKGDFMDCDTALTIFRRVLEVLPALEEAA